MALQKTLDLANGLTATDAYHKLTVVKVVAEGPTTNASVRVSSYIDATRAEEEGAVPLLERSYAMPGFDRSLSAESAYAQIYTFLKTLPDYDGALDV